MSNVQLTSDVKKAIMFAPKLRNKVANVLRDELKLEVNTSKTPPIGVLYCGVQMWVSEWEGV